MFKDALIALELICELCPQIRRTLWALSNLFD